MHTYSDVDAALVVHTTWYKPSFYIFTPWTIFKFRRGTYRKEIGKGYPLRRLRTAVPTDEPEDLDEAGEPSGHWGGLKWMPDTPEIGGS